MWVKSFYGTLINLSIMAGISINKIDNYYALCIIVNPIFETKVILYKSTKKDDVEKTYNYIQTSIENNIRFADIKEFVYIKNLTLPI